MLHQGKMDMVLGRVECVDTSALSGDTGWDVLDEQLGRVLTIQSINRNLDSVAVPVEFRLNARTL